MALRGNLKDFSLPDVFQLVTFSRKTGVLRIQREDEAQGSVWFRDGDVFFAQSNWHTEPLGERLVRAQRLTPQALDRALQLRSSEGEEGRRLGQILIDEGYITDKVLESFVSEQIQETIFDLMRWDEGDFDFEAMPEAVEEDIGLSVSIENVIMEGSRRLEEWTRIKKKIPSVDVVFKMATAPGEGTFEISLKPMEWNLLLLVDGTRSVAELAHETDRTDFEVARIIYGLFSAGLLEFATDEEVERLRAERTEREEKLAIIEAERRAADEAAAAETQAREAALEAEAEARRAADEAAANEAAASAAAKASEVAAAADEPAVSAEPAEVPEFLGGMSAAPSADDAAVLEEMMGAVLQPPKPQFEQPAEQPAVAPVVAVQPHVPAEDPAFMAVDHVDTGDLPMMPVPSVDELMTDLADLQVANAAAADEAASAVAAAWDESAQSDAEVGFDQSQSDALMADLGASLLNLGGVSDAAPTTVEASEPVIVAEAEVIEPAEVEVHEFVEEPVALEPEPGEPAFAQADTEVVFDFTFEASPEVATQEEPSRAASEDVEDFLAVTTAGFVFEPVSEPASLVEPVSDASVVEPPQELAEEPAEVFVRVEPVPGLEAFVQEPPQAEEIDLLNVETLAEDVVAPTDSIPVPTDDFERDLMSLGLGELPADLFGDALAAEETEPEEPTYEWVETPDPVLDVVPAPLPTDDGLHESPDFSELLESLDVEPEPVAIEPEVTLIPIVVTADADFDEDLLREVAPAETGGVISTDAFLDDITMDDMDFSGGLTDELSALTGADRPSRPTTSVNKIPDPNSAELLRRDARVDKDTLLKIIDGIKNL